MTRSGNGTAVRIAQRRARRSLPAIASRADEAQCYPAGLPARPGRLSFPLTAAGQSRILTGFPATSASPGDPQNQLGRTTICTAPGDPKHHMPCRHVAACTSAHGPAAEPAQGCRDRHRFL